MINNSLFYCSNKSFVNPFTNLIFSYIGRKYNCLKSIGDINIGFNEEFVLNLNEFKLKGFNTEIISF